MTSLFGDLDPNDIPDDPNFIPDSTYNAYLTDLKIGPTKAGDKTGATFTYTIDGGTFDGKKVTEWKQVPQAGDGMDDDARIKSLSFLKQRLISLGVPTDRMNEVDPADLIGKECLITVKNRNGFVNVNKVTLTNLGEGDSNFSSFGGM